MWPGTHQQLGATWSPDATNFAVWSPEATGMWVCLFDDEPRSSIGDLDVASPDVTRYCPPGNGYAQRGAVNAPRPNDLGTSTWTRPGRASGPPVVDDPVLVPNGAELLDWWRKLEERAKNGN